MVVGIFILSLIGAFFLTRYNDKLEDKTFLDRSIFILFLTGFIISASESLGFFIESIQLLVLGSLTSAFVISALIATLFYRKYSPMNNMEIISLFVWGVIALFLGVFFGFLATMDNPALMSASPSDFTRNGWILYTTLRNIGIYLVSTISLSIPYTMHSRTNNKIFSAIWTLAIVFFPVIHAYVLFFLLYGIAVF